MSTSYAQFRANRLLHRRRSRVASRRLPSTISKAIRTGAIPTVRRRSRLVVPAYVLQRLLDEPAGGERP